MVGASYYLDAEKGTIRNQYMVRVINKKNESVRCHLEVQAHEHPITVSGIDQEIKIPPLGEEMRPVVVTLPQSHFKGRFSIKVEVKSEVKGFSVSKVVPFVGPGAGEDE